MYVRVYVYVIKIYIMVKEYKQFMYIIYNYEFIVWLGQPKTLLVVQAQYESYTLSLKPKPQSLTLFCELSFNLSMSRSQSPINKQLIR